MNEETFNVQMRKFLKKTGITSQREIEQAVRKAIDEGRLKGDETLGAVMTLKIEALELEIDIASHIALE